MKYPDNQEGADADEQTCQVVICEKLHKNVSGGALNLYGHFFLNALIQ